MSYNAQLRSNNVIRNHEGGEAWMQSPEFELYSTVACTMSIDDKFYESAADRVNRIAALVRLVPAEYVAQLAIYARTEMHLRSVPMLLLVELSQCHSGDSLVSRATAKTIQRVDDIIELLACYQMRHRATNLKRLSHQLRKGIAMAFCKFDEYQFAKYKAQNKPITLRDALFIAHPKAESEQQELFDRIARQELQTPYTWETRLSEAGQVKGLEQKRQVWTELIKSRRMGYMAMLRNLRNMLSAEVDDETMQIVYDYLSSEQAVQNSKQLPFRFLSAYLILDNPELAQELRRLRQYEQSPGYKRYSCLGNRLDELYRKKWQMESLIQLLESPFHFVEERKVRKKRTRLTAIAKSLVELGLGNVEHWHCAVRRKKQMPNTRISSHRIKFIAYKRKQLAKLDRVYSIISKLWCRSYLFAGRRFSDPVIKRYDTPAKQCLEAAIKHSAANIPAFDAATRVCIACDTSGSMFQPLSGNSIIQCYDLALLFGAMLKHRCKNAIVGMFANTWLPVEMPSEDIIANVFAMRELEGRVGYSTNGYEVINWLIRERKVMDKVLLFTDCQLWDSWYGGESLAKSWAMYKRTIAPNAKLYLFDLAGYGQNPIDVDHEKDVYMIAGWSDKVFHMLDALEKGSSAIDEIRRIVV